MAAGNVSDQSALDLLSSPVWRSNARRGKGWLLKIEKNIYKYKYIEPFFLIPPDVL